MIDALLSRADESETTEPSDSGDDTDVDTAGRPPSAWSADSDFDAGNNGDSELPLNVTFEILKNRRRRLILKYLEDEDDPTPLGELAEHIAAIENDIDVRQLNSQQRKRVYIGLYQCHLPKMDDAGIIEYNQTRGIVELNDSATPLYEYFETQEPEQSNTGGQQYLLLTALFGVTFFAAQLASVPSMTNVVVLAFCAGMLSLAALDARTDSETQ